MNKIVVLYNTPDCEDYVNLGTCEDGIILDVLYNSREIEFMLDLNKSTVPPELDIIDFFKSFNNIIAITANKETVVFNCNIIAIEYPNKISKDSFFVGEPVIVTGKATDSDQKLAILKFMFESTKHNKLNNRTLNIENTYVCPICDTVDFGSFFKVREDKAVCLNCFGE